jgi:hypothetical protein
MKRISGGGWGRRNDGGKQELLSLEKRGMWGHETNFGGGGGEEGTTNDGGKREPSLEKRGMWGMERWVPIINS